VQDVGERGVGVQRFYPNLRLYGGDAAIPLPWLTIKGEAAYFTTSTPGAEEYVLYVIQLERMVKEWSFVGGYAGEAVTQSQLTGTGSMLAAAVVLIASSPDKARAAITQGILPLIAILWGIGTAFFTFRYR